MKRRTFLKGTFAATTAGIAIGAGLLSPSTILADWAEHKDAFAAMSLKDAITAIGGIGEASTDITITAPDIAENGAVVPVEITSTIAGVTSIHILVEKNSQPLSAIFTLGKKAETYVSNRFKIGKSGDVIAVVKAGDKVYNAKKQVKVTKGGC